MYLYLTSLVRKDIELSTGTKTKKMTEFNDLYKTGQKSTFEAHTCNIHVTSFDPPLNQIQHILEKRK